MKLKYNYKFEDDEPYKIDEVEDISYEEDIKEYYKKLSEKKGEQFKLKILKEWQDNNDMGIYYRFNELVSMAKVITDEYDKLKKSKNLKLSKDVQYFVEHFDFRECHVDGFEMVDNGDFSIKIEKGPNYFEFNDEKQEVEFLQVKFNKIRKLEADNTGRIDSCCIKIDFDNSIEFQLLLEIGFEEYTILRVHADDLIIEYMK